MIVSLLEAETWCIEQHERTNHKYSEYLPYAFHLRMVDQVARDFQYLLNGGIFGATQHSIREYIRIAIWGHDLIEDCRITYNDCKNKLGEIPANIIYAVTNEKGRNRAERANDAYYEGIRNTPGASYVKLCDRIANVQFGKLTKSPMFDKYKLENEHFTKSLGYTENHEFKEMFEYLENLFG